MWIFFILALITLIIVNSTVKIKIKEMLVDNYAKLSKLNFVVSIVVFEKFKIASFRIKKEKISKYKSTIKTGYKSIWKLLQLLHENYEKINVNKLELYLEVGTESVTLTSLLVTIISTIISLALSRNTEEKCKYRISPKYNNKYEFNLSINCIISMKLVHIIYIIYVFKRKDDEKNGRTSHRKSNDNCDEQYPRYGRCKYNYR